MATTVIVGGIKPDLPILGDTQQFMFNKPVASTQCVNTTVATSTVSPQINLDFLNASTRGFRLNQSTTTAVPGGVFSLNTVQYQGTSYTSTPLLTFNEGGLDSFAFKKSVKFEQACQSVAPVSSTDVANKSYVDGKTWTRSQITDFSTASLSLFASPTSDLSMNSKKITNLATPIVSTDAATMGYVDQAVVPKEVLFCIVTVATTGFLTATYYNGPANDGVGATLTLTNNTLNNFSMDNNFVFADSYSDRLFLIKNQGNTQNGIYRVKTPGGGGQPWVLVRDETFLRPPQRGKRLILVGYGDINQSTLWAQNCLDITNNSFTKIAGPMAGSEEETETFNKKVENLGKKPLKRRARD